MNICCSFCNAVPLSTGETFHSPSCPQKPAYAELISEASATKHDQEKPDMALLPFVGLEKVADAMTYGKKKYSAHNWRKGLGYTRLLSATLRHVSAYLRGEDKDPESGISHLAHACCNLLMVLEFETVKPEMDDRFKE